MRSRTRSLLVTAVSRGKVEFTFQTAQRNMDPTNSFSILASFLPLGDPLLFPVLRARC